jgi:hypothetical protein
MCGGQHKRVLLDVLVPTAGGLLSLVPPAIKCVVYYLLLQQLVLDLKACSVCTLAVDALVAAADSAMQRAACSTCWLFMWGHADGCRGQSSVARLPQRLWRLKLLSRLLASESFGSVCWCVSRCTNSSMRVSTAALDRQQGLEAAQQRKKNKAAERKRQGQREPVPDACRPCRTGSSLLSCACRCGEACRPAGVCAVHSCQLPAPVHSCNLSNSSCSAGLGHAHASDCPGQHEAAAAAVLNPGRNPAWPGSKLRSLRRVVFRLLIITAHRSGRRCGHNRR